MVMTVGLSKPRASGLAPTATSVKLGELSGLDTPEALEESSCSPVLASASFQSPDSVSRESFHEFVATGKVTAMSRAFSMVADHDIAAIGPAAAAERRVAAGAGTHVLFTEQEGADGGATAAEELEQSAAALVGRHQVEGSQARGADFDRLGDL